MAGLTREIAGAGARCAEAVGFLGMLERLGRGAPSQAHVLMYHRVARRGEDPSLCSELVSATPESFGEQMDRLREHHDVVSVEALVEAVRGGRRLPPRCVVITFDDAYSDFAESAWPVLKALELPAALFVPTAFPGDGGAEFWWDRLHRAVEAVVEPRELLRAAGLSDAPTSDRLRIYRRIRDRTKSLPHREAMEMIDALCEGAGTPPRIRSVLSWDELRTLSAEGLAICPHTRNHPLLERLERAEVVSEIEGCLGDLRNEIGTTPPVFAYPSGSVSRSAVRVARDLGIQIAFTTRRGVADLDRHHPLELPRLPVTAGFTQPIFRTQLLSQFARLNGFWR